MLHWIARARCNATPPARLLPFQDGVRGQLGAVIADIEAGIVAKLSNAVEFADVGDES